MLVLILIPYQAMMVAKINAIDKAIQIGFKSSKISNFKVVSSKSVAYVSSVQFFISHKENHGVAFFLSQTLKRYPSKNDLRPINLSELKSIMQLNPKAEVNPGFILQRSRNLFGSTSLSMDYVGYLQKLLHTCRWMFIKLLYPDQILPRYN